MCCWCSKEPSPRDGSFEYTQHMFWSRNKKNKFQIPTFIWMPDFPTQCQENKIVFIGRSMASGSETSRCAAAVNE